MFAPLVDINEDPATGSASAALAAYLGERDGQSSDYQINQGIEMGRTSLISAKVTIENGKSVAVEIGGHAVKTMEGTLTI